MQVRPLLTCLCVILTGCTSEGLEQVTDQNPVPIEFRSSTVVVPQDLSEEFEAMPALWSQHSTGEGIVAIPLEVRRAYLYWGISEMQASSEKEVDTSRIEVLTLFGGESELDSAMQDLANEFGMTVRKIGFDNDQGYYIFDIGRTIQFGEIAWYSDQILKTYPDLVATAAPYWEWKPGFPKLQ